MVMSFLLLPSETAAVERNGPHVPERIRRRVLARCGLAGWLGGDTAAGLLMSDLSLPTVCSRPRSKARLTDSP
jgi:hypothetical protein